MGDATMRGEVEAELNKLVGMDKVKDFFTNLRETVEYVERREEERRGEKNLPLRALCC